MTALALSKVVPVGTMPVVNAEGREAVLAVEAVVKQLPQVQLDLQHGFAPGVYARKLEIPAGTLLTGKIHRFAHWNIVLKGHIEIMTEQGVKHIKAPAMFVSPPGVKRAGFAHTDTIWVTIHPTDETDPDVIESQVVVDNYDQLDALPFIDADFSHLIEAPTE